MNNLPSELIISIFGYLSISERNRCHIVCALWKRISKVNVFWKDHYFQLVSNISSANVEALSSSSEESSDDDIGEYEEEYEEGISIQIAGPNTVLSYRNLYIDLVLRHQLFEKTPKGAGSLCFWY